MQASILPYQYGWYWISQGFNAFKMQPMALIFWALVTNLLIHLSYFVPIFGQIAFIVLTPALTFIALNACRRILQGQKMLLGDWVQPLKTDKAFGRLLKLGGVYFFFLFLASVVATSPYLDQISAVFSGTEEINPEEFMAAIRQPVFIFLGFYLLISILFWHAPALVGWHRIPIKQALFYSMIACWRNKWPMLIYAGFWAGLYYLFNLFASVLFGGSAAGLYSFFQTFASLILFAVLYSTFYPIYKTVFNVAD